MKVGHKYLAEGSLSRKFFGYYLFAGLGAVADVMIFIALLLTGFSLPVAAACSAASGAILSYMLNSKFVFGAKPGVISFTKFASVALLSSIIAGLAVPNLSQLLGSIALGKLVWMVLQAAFQFVAHSFWTFRFGK